jgi:hypothetical protein
MEASIARLADNDLRHERVSASAREQPSVCVLSTSLAAERQRMTIGPHRPICAIGRARPNFNFTPGGGHPDSRALKLN